MVKRKSWEQILKETPCEIGETVYWIKNCQIKEVCVKSIFIEEKMTLIGFYKQVEMVDVDKFGRTLFKTRHEAEIALEARIVRCCQCKNWVDGYCEKRNITTQAKATCIFAKRQKL